MKIKYIALYLLIVVLALIQGCKKENGDESGPGPVTAIETSSDYGSIKLTWTNPTDEDFFLVDINFKDENGANRSVKSSQYSNEKIIEGFGDTNDYEFKLTAYDEAGNASSPQTIVGTPMTPPYQIVINSISLVPDFGGVKVAWINETGKKVKVLVSYKDSEGNLKSVSLNAEETGESSITGLESVEYPFDVVATDVYGHESESKSFTATPLVEEKLDKSLWTVVDFSSEEPAEGAPNGLVTAAFDDNLGTFWHTQWSGGSPGYPHYFTIDMGQNVAITKFECFRRQGDSRGQTKVQFLGSTDGQNWIDFGAFDCDSGSDEGQVFNMSGTEIRYFKYVALEGPNFFAFLAEINAYGGVIEE